MLVDRGRCPAHTQVRPPWVHTKPVVRVRGRKLQALRTQLFSQQPLCVLCLALVPPRYRVATIRDHTVPLEEGGRDDGTNEQPLCEDCHTIKTNDERMRGVRRHFQKPESP